MLVFMYLSLQEFQFTDIMYLQEILIEENNIFLIGCFEAQAEISRVQFPVELFRFFIYLILPAALCPWVRLRP
jgi:hypothetical protein